MLQKLSSWVDDKNAVVVMLVLIAVPSVLLVSKLFVHSGHGCARLNNAVNNTRLLNTVVVAYESSYGNYPPSLDALGPPPSGQTMGPKASGLIDSALASGNCIGYISRYSLKKPLHEDDTFVGYAIVADPIVDGPDRWHYYTSEDAVVRSEKGRSATSESPQSQEDGCVCW